MKFTTISDVHIKNPNDCPNHEMFLKYLNSQEVKDSDKVVLLGDIFDIMVGNHKSYLSFYELIFNKLKELNLSGKEIYYIEGNHDFHIVSLLNSFATLHNLKNFKAFADPIQIKDEVSKKVIYLGHGDEIEIDNPAYQRLRFVLRSWPVKFIAHYIFSFSFVEWLGKKSSRASRNRNEKMYDEAFTDGLIQERFRRSTELAYLENPFDIIICGHSHVKDHYYSEGKFDYFNNGYFPIEKSFIAYDNGAVRFIKLSSHE